MDPTISEHVTKFVLTKIAGRNCFRLKRPFRTPGVSQQCKYYLQWKVIGIRPLPSCIVTSFLEAFLGKMVVGHKNTKVIKPPSHERIMRTFAKFADTVGKTCVNCVQSNVNMFYFRK